MALSRRTTGAAAALLLAGGMIGGGLLLRAESVAASEVTVWKSPSCGCCGAWVKHMQQAGFTVKVHELDDVDPVKTSKGVPPKLQSCHTAEVEGYILEGHVPANAVKRLLTERPAARGLSVPGMPQGSPGMETGKADPYDVVLFGTPGGAKLYERH